jgi:hypothetical protein
MKKTIIKTLLVFISIQVAHAQEDGNVKKNRLQISDVYVMPGMVAQSTYTTLAEITSIASPNSFSEDLSGFNQAFWGRSRTRNNGFLLNLGVNLSDPEQKAKKLYPQLRVGFAYTAGRNMEASLYKEERQPYDTLTSSQTGNIFFVDSLVWNSYSISNRHERIGLDLSLIFRTKSNSRWSAYGGVGISGAYTFNNYVTASKIKMKSTAITSTEYNWPNRGIASFEHLSDEIIKGADYIILSPYLPLGIDFQLSKRNDFWKRMHLIYELRPGTNISILANTTSVKPYLQHNLGIRVSLL